MIARFFATLLLLFFLVPAILKGQINYSSYVNPFIGTGGHGHTFPGAVLPFGMVQLSPDTRADNSWDGSSGYHYSDSVIYGFSHTHLSGTGCSDWGDILLMPITGSPTMDNRGYASGFSHNTEKASPGFYEVLLSKHKIKTQLTATLRTGIHRYVYPQAAAGLLLDLKHRDKTLYRSLSVRDSVTVSGCRFSSAWAKDQQVYFAMRFSKPFKKMSYAGNGQLKPVLISTEKPEGAFFQFELDESRGLIVKVAISAVSEEGALKNLETEAPHWNFDAYRQEAEKAWEQQLGKIEVKETNKEKLAVFYTALYHCFIHPSLYMDVDGQYRGRDGQVHAAKSFTNYTVFSLWDTYRALNPLFTILEPKRTSDFINSFLTQYKQSGRLPMWELSGNETDCMIAFHSVSVIADAMIKGIDGFDRQLAYEAMKAASNYTAWSIPQFNKKGFLQVDDESESVSKTLEYGYDNWCIAQTANFLGKHNEAAVFEKRALAYQHIFDPSTGLMRPRKNGYWLQPFYPAEINNHFTEGNSWQYSFYVPHDVNGLIKLHGGPQQFEKKLDELFTTKEQNKGRDQADVAGLIGQYAHGNEPSHHMAYLYNYVGKPQKAVARVRQICNEFYTNRPDGLIGNEDCGQMSAWYVFSAMGMYPVCPGQPQYILSAPLFASAKINLENGKTVSIISEGAGLNNVSAVQLNGQNHASSFVTHNFIKSGAELVFLSGKAADPDYGQRANTPSSVQSSAVILPAPLIQASSRVFTDRTEINIQRLGSSAGFCTYTRDGSEPLRTSTRYTDPFKITESGVVKARFYSDTDSSGITEAICYKQKYNYLIGLISKPDAQYAAEGPASLTDGIMGSVDWRKGDWIGVQGQNFECVADLKENKEIRHVSLNCLQDTRSWIVLPRRVNFYTSLDNKNFTLVGTIENPVKADDYTVQLHRFGKQLTKPVKARYFKIVAENFGTLPEWHEGKGGQAYVFTDELEVN